MNTRLQAAKSILPTALFVLLWMALLPGELAAFKDHGLSTSNPFTSLSGLPGRAVDKPEGYTGKASRATFILAEVPRPLPHLQPHLTTTVLEREFTVRQARAPPLCCC